MKTKEMVQHLSATPKENTAKVARKVQSRKYLARKVTSRNILARKEVHHG